MTRAYKHTPAGGGGPMAGGAIPTSMQPRPGLVRVPTKAQRRRVEQMHEPEPEIEDEVLEEMPADEQEFHEQAERDRQVDNGVTYSSVPQCTFCENTGATELLVPCTPVAHPHMICSKCVERLVDEVKAELPRRRLRLAMERLAAGAVSIEMVEQIEKLAAGQYPVKTDE